MLKIKLNNLGSPQQNIFTERVTKTKLVSRSPNRGLERVDLMNSVELIDNIESIDENEHTFDKISVI